MRPRNLILAICGLLVVGGLGALWHFLAGPDVGPEEIAMAAEAPEDSGGEAESLGGFPEAGESGARTDRTAFEAREAKAPTDSKIEDDPSATGFSVAGVVRHSGDEAPAAWVTFYLFDSTADFFHPLETDERGRFASDHTIQPGVIELRHRIAYEPGPNRRLLRFAPGTVTLTGAAGETVNVELTLLRPEAELDVLVVHRDDRPAPGAIVRLQVRNEIGEGEFRSDPLMGTTLADGCASFALYDLELIVAASLVANLRGSGPDGREQILVSVQHDLEMPVRPHLLADPVRLVLDEAGSILIRVKDTEGSPVTGQGAFVSSVGPATDLLGGLTPASDERGEILKTGLPPTTYTVKLLNAPPATSEPEVTVFHGEISEVDIVLPVTRPQLAVSGTVVDEEGEPLEFVTLFVACGPRDGPDETWEKIVTEAQGRFECYAIPCDRVTVFLDHDLFGHDYDPAKLDLSFGATDVQFRRVQEIEVKPFSLEVVDSVSDERLDQVLLMTYRAPVRSCFTFYRTEKGLASPYIAHHPRTTIVFELQGYRRVRAGLEELRKQEPADGLHRVTLDRGLLRWLRVEENEIDGEGAPVAGARILLQDELLGRTDERGEFLVDLYTWPEQALTIEAEGYAVVTWMADEGLAVLAPARVGLERE